MRFLDLESKFPFAVRVFLGGQIQVCGSDELVGKYCLQEKSHIIKPALLTPLMGDSAGACGNFATLT